MKADEYFKGEISEIKHCPVRLNCPVHMLCGDTNCATEKSLFPSIIEVGKDELVWVSNYLGEYVYVVLSGVYLCMAHGSEKEIPFALYGKGNVIGMVELFAPTSMSGEYHLYPLIPGKICKIPNRPLRKKLEQLSYAEAMNTVCFTFSTSANAILTQSKILAKKGLYDRIITLLSFLYSQTAETEDELPAIKLTHAEIAQITLSDRISVTRVLRNMEKGGILELGYKTIKLCSNRYAFNAEESPQYINLNEWPALPKNVLKEEGLLDQN